jgi:SAM-dependent methyltransferase
MNRRHLEFCASPEWADIVENEILPWAVGDLDLGDDVLEVGSGPGLTTDVLRRRVPRLTAVEIDPDLAGSLKERLRDSNVQVVHADATRLPLESGRFSAAASFAMLHHVPSRELQRFGPPASSTCGSSSASCDRAVLRGAARDSASAPQRPDPGRNGERLRSPVGVGGGPFR